MNAIKRLQEAGKVPAGCRGLSRELQRVLLPNQGRWDELCSCFG